MTCLVFYTLKIIWMSVFVLFYGVFYGVWITHAWCYMMRDSLYRCTEKVLWCIGKALWVYGKAYIGVRKSLYWRTEKAIWGCDTGFFAAWERLFRASGTDGCGGGSFNMLVYNGLCCLFKTDVLCGGFLNMLILNVWFHRFKIRVYGGGTCRVGLCAILSELTLYCFSHNLYNMVWICEDCQYKPDAFFHSCRWANIASWRQPVHMGENNIQAMHNKTVAAPLLKMKPATKPCHVSFWYFSE